MYRYLFQEKFYCVDTWSLNSFANMYVHFMVLIVVSSSIQIYARPLEQKNNPTQNNVIEFMKKYGYVEPDTGSTAALYTEEGLTDVIKNIQKFGAIPQTGKIDNATLKLMSSPRCGVPDVRRHNRQKRFALGSKGWNKRNITYFIANWPHSLGEDVVDKDVKLALSTWGKYGRLEFHRAYDANADINVLFAGGYHGDYFPFDGRGSVLAHAYFPYEGQQLGGDIHFDADEDWRIESEDEGTHFFSVAVHELGHSLGLAHSFVETSIMFPYYRRYNKDFALDYDDILGMYELYIKRQLDDDVSPPITPKSPYDEDEETYDYDSVTSSSKDWFPTTTTTNTNNHTINYEGDTETVDDHRKHETTTTNSLGLPDICQGNFDAVATLRNEMFIFKNEYVWRLRKKHHIEDGYPVLIKQMFPELPDDIKNIDAAYERPDGMIVIFTGNKFWISNGNNFVENSPQPISRYGLPSNLNKIDAVQLWGKNGKTYIYKGDYFWRYNETSKIMDPGYPKHIERWRGIPGNLDAATTWKDGITYFFKGKLYWTFDNNWVIATDSSPLPTTQVWLGCPEDDY